ncbi:MAG: DUF5131 family protein [Rhodospirillaceae bacterium]
MGDRSRIEWTDASWTPIRARNRATGKVGWHCEHVSEGCRNCYAERWNRPYGTGLPYKPGHRADVELFLDEQLLTQPLRWRRPRRVFVCSMTDLFADFVPDEWIDRVFAVMGPDVGRQPDGSDPIVDGRARAARWDGADWRFYEDGYKVPLDAIGRVDDVVYRVGKKAAGRLLDGVLHDAYPEPRS